MTYFAYVHAVPALEMPRIFYVGKGKNGRDKDLSARNRHHGFILKKFGKENILTGKLECSSEEIAFDLERGLIKCLRRMNVKLTNMTDGGDGASGYKHTAEGIEKLRVSGKEISQRDYVKEAKSKASTKHNLKRWQNPEHKEKLRAAMRGVKKTLSLAALEARQKNAKLAQSKEAIAKRSAASKKMWADPEFKAMMSEKRKKSWHDPEKRENMLKGRSEGIAESWKDQNVREKRIAGIKNSSIMKKE